MSLIQNKLQNLENEKLAAEQKAASENYRPSETDTQIIERITKDVSEKYRDSISEEGFSPQVMSQIKIFIAEQAKQEGLSIEQQKRIEYMVTASVAGLGPLEVFMNDSEVTEIVVQRWDNICVEKRGIVHHVETTFNNEQHLQTVINRIVQPVGRQINLSVPIVDARLADGSRVNATIPPVTPDGATLTIRKFPEKMFSGADYINLDSLNVDMLKFLSYCVRGKISLIVSGGTSTGKTTLLNVLSQFIPENELIVTIEDLCELRLSQSNVRRMEVRPVTSEGMLPINIQTLVKNSLRMRPDRIIVGEVRDGTIVDLMSAMSTGHEGSMSTVHANSPTNLVNSRIPILYSMNEAVDFSTESQNVQISEALQLIVQVSRMKDGSRKITHITHVYGLLDDGRVRLEDIFRYNKDTGEFEKTGYVPKDIIRRAKANNVIIPESLFKNTSNGSSLTGQIIEEE